MKTCAQLADSSAMLKLGAYQQLREVRDGQDISAVC